VIARIKYMVNRKKILVARLHYIELVC